MLGFFEKNMITFEQRIKEKDNPPLLQWALQGANIYKYNFFNLHLCLPIFPGDIVPVYVYSMSQYIYIYEFLFTYFFFVSVQWAISMMGEQTKKLNMRLEGVGDYLFTFRSFCPIVLLT